MAKVTRPRTTSPKAPKPAISAVPDNPTPISVVPDKSNGHASAEVQSAIRARAYQLYESRGRQDGFDQKDWFQAEAEVLGHNQRRTA